MKLILPPGLGEVGLGLVEVAQVGVAGLRQRELLAAHVVELLLDLGLLLEGRQLKLGIGENGQHLALGDVSAVLDQLLIDPPAFDRIEIDGDKRRNPRPQRQEIVERAGLARPRSPAGRAAPPSKSARGANSQNSRISNRAAAASSADQDSPVDPLAHDDAVHRAAADGVRTGRVGAAPPGSLSTFGQ